MKKKLHPLAQYRAERGLTQQQVSEMTGVDRRTLSKIENGDIKKPSWEHIHDITEGLFLADPRKLFPIQKKKVKRA